MAGIMAAGAIASGVSGGLNAKAEQQKIKNAVCQMAAQMEQYKAAMSQEASILDAAAAAAQSEADQLAMQISGMKSTIQLQHVNFKKTYNRWVVISVIFLILLVFVFASKKIILHATTEPN